jgi:hypothetical protein
VVSAGVRRWTGGLSLAATILASPFGSGAPDDPGAKAPALSHLYSDSGRDGYRLVWRGLVGFGSTGHYALFTRRIDDRGRPANRIDLVGDPGSGGYALTPTVQLGEVVWVGRRRGRPWAVYARNVDAPGKAGRVRRLSRFSASPPGRPAILFNMSNQNFLVAWAGPHHRGVKARILDYYTRRPESKVLTVAPASDRVSDPTLGNRQAGFIAVLWTRPQSHDQRIHFRLVRTGTDKLNRPRTLPGIDPRRVLDSDRHLSAIADEPTATFDHLAFQNLGVAWTVSVRDSAGRRASAIVAQQIDVEGKHRLAGPTIVALARNPGRRVRGPRIAFRNKTELYDLVWAREASDGCGSVEHALLRSDPWRSRPFRKTVLSSTNDPGGCARRRPTLSPIDPSASSDGRVLYAWESGRYIAGSVR